MANKNDLLFDKPTLVNGGQTNEAVVVTSPDKQPVNAPTVEDIQRIAKGIAEKEAEAASATEWEKDLKPNLYYDKTNDDIVVKKELVDGNGDAIIPDAYTKTESDARYSGKLYNHNIMVLDTSDNSVEFNVICNKATAFNSVLELRTELANKRLAGLGCKVYEQSSDEEFAGAIDNIHTIDDNASMRVLYKTTSLTFAGANGAYVYSDEITTL